MNNLASHDDYLWQEVEYIAWRWACLFRLPMISVEPYPAHGTGGCWGWCDPKTGRVAICVRESSFEEPDGDSLWNEKPLSAFRILDTLAHELAHFAHSGHGKKHKRLHKEIFDDMVQEGMLQRLHASRCTIVFDKSGRRVVT